MKTNPTTLRNFAFFYFALGLTEIYVELRGIAFLKYGLKPLLMISLAIFYFTQSKAASKFDKLIITALVFSLFGDIALMLPPDSKQLSFMAGLVSFLIAHVFYILGFANNIKESQKPLKAGEIFASALPFLAFGVSFFLYMKDDLHKMLLPVLFYTSVICTMGTTAALRNKRVNAASFIWVLAGAIIFILSDSTIALSKFVFSPENPLPYARLIIMALYITAQYLIAVGSLKKREA